MNQRNIDIEDVIQSSAIHSYMILVRLLLIPLALSVATCCVHAETATELGDKALWRFTFDNDLGLQSDDFFSAGWSFQRHSAHVGSWDNLNLTKPYMTQLVCGMHYIRGALGLHVSGFYGSNPADGSVSSDISWGNFSIDYRF